jgi:hypothetical protein
MDNNPKRAANLRLPGPGRPKGSPNVKQSTQSILDELGFDPIRECIKRYRDEKVPQASRDSMMKLVIERTLPALRAIEVTGAGGSELKNILISIVAGTLPQSAAIQPLVIDANPLQQALEWATEDDEEDQVENGTDLDAMLSSPGTLRHPGD